MASVVEQNVLRLEITVDNLESMETLKSAQQLCGVKTGTVDVETLLPLQVVKQFATVHKCEYKIQLFW